MNHKPLPWLFLALFLPAVFDIRTFAMNAILRILWTLALGVLLAGEMQAEVWICPPDPTPDDAVVVLLRVDADCEWCDVYASRSENQFTIEVECVPSDWGWDCDWPNEFSVPLGPLEPGSYEVLVRGRHHEDLTVEVQGPDAPCSGSTLTVDPAGGGDFTEIQAAIDAAQCGDTVLVAPGEYEIDAPLTFGGKEIAVRSTEGARRTVVRAPGADRVVLFDGGETEFTVLEGFVLAGGRHGVHCAGSSPTLVSCEIRGNLDAGVVCVPSGDSNCPRGAFPRILDCVIDGNGGLGVSCSGSGPYLVNCTITRNGKGGVRSDGYGFHYGDDSDSWWSLDYMPSLTSSIVWDNGVGPSLRRAEGRYSAIEGESLWPGEGNINADPRLRGWGEAAEVWVDTSAAEPGDGTPESPFSGLTDALRYSLALAADSPCLGAGEDGADMGAATGAGGAAGVGARLVHLAPGTYSIVGSNLAHGVSIEGAGTTQTVIEGTVFGLETGAILSDVTVAAGAFGGIVVGAEQDPEIRRSSFAGNSGRGIECVGSTGTFTSCTVRANLAGGVSCREGASPVFDDCTISANSESGVDCSLSYLTLRHSTVAGNLGHGIDSSRGSSVTLSSCIVWDNRGEAVTGRGSFQVVYSSIEFEEIWPGEGNSNANPLFCGWGDVAEVWVDASQTRGGDGSPGAPYPDLFAALEYSFALSEGSPCLGAGEHGTDMGAATERCGPLTRPTTRLVHISAGTYRFDGLVLSRGASLRGAGEKLTTVEDSLWGLRTGTVVSDLTVRGATGAGMVIEAGEAPVIERCTVADSGESGFHCEEGSSPRLISCTVLGNDGSGVVCEPGSSPEIVDSTIQTNAASGILCEAGSAPEITDSTIRANAASGVRAVAGSAITLTRCEIRGNTGTEGGGVSADRDSTLMLSDCAVAENSAEDGAGVHCDGIMTATRCTFTGNVARGAGGGARASSQEVRLIDCRIAGNSAANGGGVSGAVTMTGCELTANSASEAGGGIAGDARLEDSVVMGNRAGTNGGGFLATGGTVSRCTFTQNRADVGGGIFLERSKVLVTSSIVWNNQGGAIEPEEGPEVTFSCVEVAARVAWPGDGNIAGDPLFCGWLEAGEVWVDPSLPGSGDGSAANPHRDFDFLFDWDPYSISLTADSPCRGGGEGGVDMGAPAGTCARPGRPQRMVHLVRGTHVLQGIEFPGGTLVAGAGQGVTLVEGSVDGLYSSVVVSDLTVGAAGDGSVVVPAGEAPVLRRVTIRGAAGVRLRCERGSSPRLEDCSITGILTAAPRVGATGVRCEGDSSPSLTRCSITGTDGVGVFCASGSSPQLDNCTLARNSSADRAAPAGAMYCQQGSTATLTGCVIADNSALVPAGCGGIFCEESSRLALDHCTLAGNAGDHGELYCPTGSLTSSILWGNDGRSWLGPEVTVSHSCVESVDFLRGMGTLGRDPLFRGWVGAAEVWVDSRHGSPGDGAPSRPFSRLADALAGYSLSLCEGSPCLGTGKDGTNMGAVDSVSEGRGPRTRIVHVAGGTYILRHGNLANVVNVSGAGAEETVIEGTVVGLRSGALLSHLTVNGGRGGGIRVGVGETPAIVDCVIADNISPALGGGIYCAPESSPTLVDCSVSANRAEIGGGVAADTRSSVSLTRCRVAGNATSGDGGGIYCAPESSITLVDCSVSANRAETGGGIAAGTRSSVSLTRCQIDGNVSREDGGGIYADRSPGLMLADCVVAENSAGGNGGGILSSGFSKLTAVNCVIARNSAPGELALGGGAFCERDAHLVNCTIADNLAGYRGGGIYFRGPPTVVNCIVWGNSGGSLRIARLDRVVSRVEYSSIEGDEVWRGEGNIALDPLFADSEAGDYRLRAGSPAIGTGTRAGAPERDIDGALRTCGATVDMGAYEHGACTPFLRGDVDGSGFRNLVDSVVILNYLFLGGAAPDCFKATDVNDDAEIDLSDATFLLSFLFLGGTPPPEPFAQCGGDPTDDDLTCQQYAPCE